MSLSVRPARRSEAKPLVGLYSRSGCGKTLSALYLARGFVGPGGKIVMIETEAGRGEVYADVIPGGYEVISMRDTFSPKRYGEAIGLAEKTGADAVIIDSASREWEGVDGVLDMAAQNQAKGYKGPRVWTEPKISHAKDFLLRLLQTPASLVVLCMRAKYPMEETIKNGKREWSRSSDLTPKQSEDILFEMFVHGWIDERHTFNGTKYTRPELEKILPTGQPLSIELGERFAAWARGGTTEGSAAKATSMIAGAPTAKDLQGLAATIQQLGLTGSDRQAALDAYADRMATLRAAEDAGGARAPDRYDGIGPGNWGEPDGA